MPRRKKTQNLDNVRELVLDCIGTNNIEVLIHLLYNLQCEYNELASLATLGKYKKTWSHKNLLDYITKEI